MNADVCWLPPDDQGTPASPPFRSVEGARTREAYLAAVEQFRVETAPRYRARAGLTWCNLFVADVTAAMGCAVPKRLANEQLAWLSAQGAKRGWQHVDGAKAYMAALSGCPAVAAWANPEGHGHIAMVVPVAAVPGKHAELRIAQAGRANFSNGALVSGFGSRSVEFFAHP